MMLPPCKTLLAAFAAGIRCRLLREQQGWRSLAYYQTQTETTQMIDDEATTTTTTSSNSSKIIIPWMMVSSPAKPESRFLYDPIIHQNITRELHLPQIAFHHLIGSSQGFLFSINDVAEIHATNPLTGAKLPLPPTAHLPNVVGIIRDPPPPSSIYNIALDQVPKTISKYVVCVNRWANPPEFRTIDIDPQMRNGYYSKAILSPSLDTALVIYNSYSFHDPSSAQIAFCRFAAGGEELVQSWTALRSPFNRFHDIIFHKGRLHAVDRLGTIAVFNDDDLRGPPILLPVGSMWGRMSLVESPDGEDLFLICRDIYDADDVNEDDEAPPRTHGFAVLKLDHSNYKWVKTTSDNSIEGHAVFVGYNHSLALSPCDCPGLQPNSIYFTDHYLQGLGCNYKPEMVGDCGVYRDDDKSLKFYPLSLCFKQESDEQKQESDDQEEEEEEEEFNWPPPIWYMPIA